MEKGYDVLVIAYMLVYCDFHLQLPRTNLAMAGGIFFVNELHREDRLVLLEWTCLFDAVTRSIMSIFLSSSHRSTSEMLYEPGIGALPDCFRHNAEWQLGGQRGQLRVLHGLTRRSRPLE